MLEVENLRVRYRNGAIGVSDVSFSVAESQIVALFGPNGAGKTTVARAVSGFLRSEGARVIGGLVRFEGRTVTNFEPHRMARLGVACVPERKKIFANLTVRENLHALSKAKSKSRRKARLEQVFELFPVLAERQSQLAGQMSGGQQQMLAIARSLLVEPKLLIIDEMTLGLHPSLQAPLFGAVSRVAEGGTSVLIIDESTGFALQSASYCYLLGAGTVLDEASPEKFRGNELLAAGYIEGGS